MCPFSHTTWRAGERRWTSVVDAAPPHRWRCLPRSVMVIVVASFCINARIWVDDYPPDIRGGRETMSVTVRAYRQRDANALADIYNNTIHRVNVRITQPSQSMLGRRCRIVTRQSGQAGSKRRVRNAGHHNLAQTVRGVGFCLKAPDTMNA